VANCLLVHIPPDQSFVFLLPDPPDEARASKLLSHPVRRQSILREAKVEERGHVNGAANLLLLLDQVGTSDVADGDLVAELREQLLHLRLDKLARGN
jgi:hypothetical protein